MNINSTEDIKIKISERNFEQILDFDEAVKTSYEQSEIIQLDELQENFALVEKKFDSRSKGLMSKEILFRKEPATHRDVDLIKTNKNFHFNSYAVGNSIMHS